MSRTKTNFQTIDQVKDYWMNNWIFIKRSFVNKEQKQKIEEICEFDKRTPVELRDLRDLAVLLLSDASRKAREEQNWEKFDKLHDCMSALTHIIDCRL